MVDEYIACGSLSYWWVDLNLPENVMRPTITSLWLSCLQLHVAVEVGFGYRGHVRCYQLFPMLYGRWAIPKRTLPL